MKIFILLLLSTLLFSKVYYAKVNPYEIRTISSNVSGLVLFTNEYNLGEKLSSKPYIRIDSDIEVKELHAIESKLVYLKDVLNSTKQVLANLKELLEKKRLNYQKVKVMSIKSQLEKDREFYNLIASENQYLSTKKEINNLQIQIVDTQLRESKLQRIIHDKTLRANGFVLYSLFVKPGQVVGISTPLAQVADISKAKLTIYLDKEDVVNAKAKSVYIDGKKTSYKISRVINITDSKNISKYLAQIIIDSPKIFSNLIKVELKDD